MMDFGKCFLYTVPPPTFLHVMVSVTHSQPQSENNEWKMLEANILCSFKTFTIVRNVMTSTSSCLGCKPTLCPAYTLCICSLSLRLAAVCLGHQMGCPGIAVPMLELPLLCLLMLQMPRVMLPRRDRVTGHRGMG